MVSVVGLVGIALLVLVQTAIAALFVRFLRVRLDTRWGVLLYVLFFVPLALTVSTLVLSGVLGLGGDLGARSTAVFVAILVPFALGVTIDVLWMPAPEEVDLPETT